MGRLHESAQQMEHKCHHLGHYFKGPAAGGEPTLPVSRLRQRAKVVIYHKDGGFTINTAGACNEADDDIENYTVVVQGNLVGWDNPCCHGGYDLSTTSMMLEWCLVNEAAGDIECYTWLRSIANRVGLDDWPVDSGLSLRAYRFDSLTLWKDLLFWQCPGFDTAKDE
ncbi:hypothetical protein CEK25_012314 [Fusarium fujikuroi]|nr:hypothetical protein CEK25_012314 [Fusarium fujikuroi]